MSQHRQRSANFMARSQVNTATESNSNTSVTGTLRLRGEITADSDQTEERAASSRRIRWDEDVVNNEGMGKKSSKVCCIYHKARPPGESSSESSSSDSSSSDDTDSDIESKATKTRGGSTRGRHQNRPRDGCGDESTCPAGRDQKQNLKRRKPSPNAYEKVPKSNARGSTKRTGP